MSVSIHHLKSRLDRLKRALAANQTGSAYLVSHPANLSYLTGLTTSPYHREIWLLVTPEFARLFHSPLITPPDRLKSLFTFHSLGQTRLTQYVAQYAPGIKMFVDAHDLSLAESEALSQNTSLKLIPANQLLTNLRAIKDESELTFSTRAGRLTTKTWSVVKPLIKPGMSELAVANLIVSIMTEHGSQPPTEEFMPIVAFGPHSAIPHHQPTSRKLHKTDVVLVDFGCRYRGYWSDMTRTFQVGRPSSAFSHAQTMVKTAYRIGLNQARVNHSNQAIDEAVHHYLVSQKHDAFMNHTTGHGIGLEVHETPSISRLAAAFTLLQNTLITIEPGLYFPGQFGYRFENTIAITDNLPISLTGR